MKYKIKIIDANGVTHVSRAAFEEQKAHNLLVSSLEGDMFYMRCADSEGEYQLYLKGKGVEMAVFTVVPEPESAG